MSELQYRTVPLRKPSIWILVATTVVLFSPAVNHARDAFRYEPLTTIGTAQWDTVDIRFAVDSVPDQPDHIDFSAMFTHKDGDSLTVAGFYDGGTDYVIRFTPPAAGEWQYETTSSISKLDRLSGEVAVRSANEGRRGGVLVDAKSKRRFVHENGDHYYPIAFEADWLFALDAENASDIPKTRSLVDTLADSGFNQIVLNVFAYDVNWKKDDSLAPEFDYGSPRVFPFKGTNQEPDHSGLNIQYFQRLDRVLDYLDQKGIVAHLMIYVWNKRVSWPEANSDADNRYFDYVVRRYQAYPNLVWDISKEALGYGHNDVSYITDRIQRLRKVDVYDRLVTVHDYGYCRKFPEQVDFVSVQLWSSELYGVMRKVMEAIPGKPILNIEHGGYERGPYVVFTGNYISPEVCLERAYQCVFAGTFPTHYWQGSAWNVVIPDIAALPADEQPRLDYYRHMRRFVDRFQVDQLIAGDKKSNAGFCLHNGKDLFLYYVPKECDFLGLRPPKDRGDTMRLTWLDPFTGEHGEPFEMKITQWPSVEVPAGDGFRILICELDDDVPEPLQSRVLFDFENDQQLEAIEKRDIDISRVKSNSGSALLVESGHAIDWPGITLKPTQGTWDLGRFQHLSFNVENQGDEPFEIGLKIESRNADGVEKNFTVMNNIAAKESRKISGTLYTTPWKFTTPLELQGMHAAPGQRTVDPSSVTQVVIFLRQPKQSYRFTIDNVKVETPMTQMDVDDFLPFIDEFGQFIHKQWPGKADSHEDLVASRELEKKELASKPGPASFNRFGGWKDGPRHSPAKFFRVEKHDGRWWLIDPDGSRFWSHGMDAVSTRFGGTGIEHRENYFRGLPKEESKLGKYYFASTWAFGFYADKTPYKMYNHLLANLHRKYGEDYRAEFEGISHKRLRSWGFNTLASWCDPSVNRQQRTPYVEFVYVEDGPVLEGAQKMWTQFHDVFDPRFRQSIAHGMEKVKYSVGDSWCMGYYVDNELYWGSDIDLALWTLRCNPKQAAKQEFLKDLTAKYETIDALNQAWGTEHASWSDLAETTRTPDVKKANENLRQFSKKTSETYFRTVKEELAKAAPGQLYLGCRFIWDNGTAIRAACKYADVVSFNRYWYSVDQMTLPDGEDKPILVGEFHFGALDRGLFHPTRAPAKNQKNRGDCYKNYVLSALRNPLFVGTHWFQYYDEPTAGRGDGENYNTGFLDVCDKPYPEMISAAREVADRMYEYRNGSMQ